MTCTTKQTKGKWLTIAQKCQVIEEHGRSQPSPLLTERLASYVEACLSQHTCLSRRLITFKARQILASITNPLLSSCRTGG
ncbi:hypothetical protein PF011_g30975 [Phytophthora fragariae]|uniref:HTH CENPB-type domain-containing protein n=1 Tax=Phytophthora fragariae TaxID=53985 RepID=A0A6A3GML5_9STRA|nr:hypothetical protein PF011_g30975 [Phytophthora fragariae]